MNLSDDDMERLAERVAAKLEPRKAFWVEAEQHYKDHMAWESFRQDLTADDLSTLRRIARAYSRTAQIVGQTILLGALAAVLAAAAWFAGKGS